MTVFRKIKTLGQPVTQTYTVGVTAIDAANLVAVDAGGLIVPASDASAVTFLGWSEESGAPGAEIRCSRGIVAFNNSSIAPVGVSELMLQAKVGGINDNISISGAAEIINIACGQIVNIDQEGQIWIDTRVVTGP